MYESLWNIVGFIFINAVYKKKKFDGQIFYMYIAWYGFGRMFIEGLRTDSLYVGVFRISQVVGFICFIVGTLMLTLNLLKSRRARLTSLDYEPAYPKFVTTASMGKTYEQIEETEETIEEDIEDSPNEEESSEESDERTDLSDKIGKIFNIDTDK